MIIFKRKSGINLYYHIVHEWFDTILKLYELLNINIRIYQESLSEVGQGFLSILLNGDKPLYLKLALCFKFKLKFHEPQNMVRTVHFPTLKPAFNY